MHTAEMILAFRLAEEQGFVVDLACYANCTWDCPFCPASTTCDYLAASTIDNTVFKSNFDSLVRPHLQQYTMEHIKSHYPELLI
jgi:DNA repair photolyase